MGRVDKSMRHIGGRAVYRDKGLLRRVSRRHKSVVSAIIQHHVSSATSLSLDSTDDQRTLIDRLLWALGLDT